MTDTNGLLRDAGGARPASDVDALIERLHMEHGCRVPRGCEICEAAAALVQLREEISARSDLMQGYLDCWRNDKERAERAEAEVARLKDRVEQRDRQIAVYNSGGFADADALAEKFIELTAKIATLEAERDAWKSKLLAEEVEHDATMAERDALKAERADLIKINNRWAHEWDAMREQVEEMRKVIEAAKAMRDRQEIEVVTDPRVLAFDAALAALDKKQK